MNHAALEQAGPTTPHMVTVALNPFRCSDESRLAGERLHAAPSIPSTCSGQPSREILSPSSTFLLQQLTLVFRVTEDEEYVQLSLLSAGGVFDLGARNHNYLLLCLARRRLKDRNAGSPEDSCGWVDLRVWSHDPSMCPPRLNMDVFRIRQQFAACGVADAYRVIERRTPRRQIRLGTSHVQITVV